MELRKKLGVRDEWSQMNMRYMKFLHKLVSVGDKEALMAVYYHSRGEQEARFTGDGKGEAGEKPTIGGKLTDGLPDSTTIAVTRDATELGGDTVPMKGWDVRMYKAFRNSVWRLITETREPLGEFREHVFSEISGAREGLEGMRENGLEVSEVVKAEYAERRADAPTAKERRKKGASRLAHDDIRAAIRAGFVLHTRLFWGSSANCVE